MCFSISTERAANVARQQSIGNGERQITLFLDNRPSVSRKIRWRIFLPFMLRLLPRKIYFKRFPSKPKSQTAMQDVPLKLVVRLVKKKIDILRIRYTVCAHRTTIVWRSFAFFIDVTLCWRPNDTKRRHAISLRPLLRWQIHTERLLNSVR